MVILREEEISPSLPSCSSSSSSAAPRWKHDVFLSFRGKDTRKGFTDHLFNALKQKSIYTFRDEERLVTGKSIAPELLKAIEESRFAVIVFSRNYAGSTWCLDELAKIVECMKETKLKVLPVFYDVDPSDVRHQKGIFAEAFAKHEERFKENMEKVQTWRETLREVGNLSGWHVNDRHESSVIKEIVRKISSQLTYASSSVFKDLVGIDARVEEIMKLYLRIESDDVRFIGILGMAGIGKSTLASVICREISYQFDAYYFLANVREKAKKHGLIHLQKELVSNILKESNVDIWDVRKGMDVISSRLCHIRVLIILDDVDTLKQLEVLAGKRDWFGQGSRIIITTRYEDLLINHKVAKDEIYKAQELNNDEALKLFSLKAFEKEYPAEGYLELSNNVVKYANGLPLALEVLGSFLHDNSVEAWKDALGRLEEIPRKDIHDTLQLSFDGLQESEKKIFLDIACFFKGKDKDRVVDILESCDYHPIAGIKALIKKSLITILGRKLWMHDLLQEMGQAIVTRESPEELGERSRLWVREDVLHVLENDMGTEKVESMVLDSAQQAEVRLINAKAFLKMKKLRLLKICNVHFAQEVDCLSNNLRVIEWPGYPSKSMPVSFPPNKLVELILCCSQIKQLWTGIRSLDKLKHMELSDSKNLIETPDFTGAPNLEHLILQGCIRLSKVHPSIGYLKRLILLNLKDCKCLNSLPSGINLTSLEIFILSGCSSLKKFPEIVGNMTCLSQLYLDGTAIKELPSSVEHLTGLTLLNLRDCKHLSRLPSVICSLTSIRTLTLSGCLDLEEMPQNLGNLEYLEELDVSGTALRQASPSIIRLKNLKQLSFRGCKGLPPNTILSLFSCLLPSPDGGFVLPTSFSGLFSLTDLNLSYCNLLDGAIPDDFSSLSSLQSLDLSGNRFTSLPESICQLSKLRQFNVTNCSSLRSLPKLPLSIQFVLADDCTLLQANSNKYDVWAFSSEAGVAYVSLCRSGSNQSPVFRQVNLSDAGSLILSQRSLEAFVYHRKVSGFVSLNLTEIPKWFSIQSTGSFATVQLDQDLDDNSKWTGFALFVVHHDHGNLNSTIDYSKPILESKDLHEIVFHFETDEGRLKKPLVVYIPKDPSARPTGSLVHISRAWFSEQSNKFDKWSYIQTSITTSSTDLEVKQFGVHLLYEQDALKFVKTIRQCYVAVQDQGCKIDSIIQLERDLQSLLLRCYEVNRAKNKIYKYIFPLKASPEWFIDHGLGHSVSVYLPPNLYDDKRWVGFALYACFVVHERPTTSNDNFFGVLGTDDGCLQSCIIFPVTRDMFVESHRLLVFHIPRVFFTNNLNQRREIQVSFSSFCPNVEVVVCGMRVVYEQDLQGLVETIANCISVSPDVYHQGYHESLVDQVNSFPINVHETKSSEPWKDKMPCDFGYSSSSQRRHYNSLERYLGQVGGISRDSDSNCIQEGFDFQNHIFSHCFPQREIPEWFCRHNGSSIRFDVNPELYNLSVWGGIALCASFTNLKHPTLIHDNLGSESYHKLNCDLESDVGWMTLNVKNITESQFSKSFWLNQRTFIWVLYIPLGLIVDKLIKCNLMRIVFKSKSQELFVQNCGHGLVFQQNMDEFLGTIIKCSTTFSDNLQLIHQFVVDDNRNNKQRHNDEGESSETGRTSGRFRGPSYQGETSVIGNQLFISEQQIRTCKDFLKKHAEDVHPCFIFDHCFPPCEIPKSFNHCRIGPSVTIELPSNFYSNWMGFALYASFSVEEYPSEFLDNLELEVPHHLICIFETDIGSLTPIHVYRTAREEFKWLHLHGFIWLSYIPHCWFSNRFFQCKHIEVSIVSDWPGLMVQKCGLRLLYLQDAQEIRQMITHCTVSFFDNWDLIRKDLAEQDSTSNACPISAENQGSKSDSTIRLKRKADQWFLTDYEDKQNSYHGYVLFLQGGISTWFNRQSTGPSIEIQLPSNLCNDERWKGLAICTIFAFPAYYSCGNLDSTISLTFTLHLDSNEGCMEPNIVFHGLGNKFVKSHYLWILHISRAVLPLKLNEWIHIRATFECNWSDVVVEKCGIRLLYEQDSEGFVQTMTECVLPTSEVHCQDYSQYLVGRLISMQNCGPPSNFPGFSPKSDLQDYDRCCVSAEKQGRKSDQLFLRRYEEQQIGYVLSHQGGIGIPLWFSHQSTGPSIEIQLPPILCNDHESWKGLAICTVFAFPANYSCGNMDSTISLAFTIHLDSNEGCMEPTFSFLRLRNKFVKSHYLWILHISREVFPLKLNEWIHIRATFKCYFPSVEVEKCGIRLVYKQDSESFVHTMTECVLASSEFNRHDSDLCFSLTSKSCKGFQSSPFDNMNLFHQLIADEIGEAGCSSKESSYPERLRTPIYQSSATGISFEDQHP